LGLERIVSLRDTIVLTRWPMVRFFNATCMLQQLTHDAPCTPVVIRSFWRQRVIDRKLIES